MKVDVKIKKWNPRKIILDMVLRPGFEYNLNQLIQLIVKMFNMKYMDAEHIVYDTLQEIDYESYTWRDRDKLNLPNISNCHPYYKEVCKYWNNKITY